MDMWACANPQTILDGVKKPGWIKMMKDCHMKGFFVTSFDVTNAIPIEDVAAVKHILDEEGFEMIGIGVPLGHPEGLDTPCYTFHEGWHIRHDINNELVRWCNAITPQLVKDTKKCMEEQREVGIKGMFWDDDLRQGNYEGDVQGCFCDDCIAEFAEKFKDVIPGNFSRESLRPVIAKDPTGLDEDQLALREAWMKFNCDRVTYFMDETNIDGMQNGIMVMHNGDRRHGIDIPDIIKVVPDCLFRVGELMFGDESFEKPGNKRALVAGVLKHMELMGDVSRIYSESTVYPHGALTPENLRQKIVLERKCGIENINLMGVERMNSIHYYNMLRDNYERFEEIQKEFTLDNLDLVE
ncbi:MAG: hypothetical protein E7487_10795 [Ruminococcaceae bacterium]|nr:hypothetical protein [Oscillospiraceae bacterium]